MIDFTLYTKEQLQTILWLLRRKRIDLVARAAYYETLDATIVNLVFDRDPIVFNPETLALLKHMIFCCRKITDPVKLKRATYKAEVYKLSKCQPTHLLPNADKPKALYKLWSSPDHYVIDHKISVAFGLKNNIPIEAIAHISNLRWFPAKENRLKSDKNHIDEDNQWIIDKYCS